jgi:hypothetical protein
MAKYKVIAGDYLGQEVLTGNKLLAIVLGFGIFNVLQINKNTVKTYELITEEHQKSAKSGIAKGLVGGALLGPVGMIAGAFSAKNKGRYTVALEFIDGKKSLIEVDELGYKTLITRFF